MNGSAREIPEAFCWTRFGTEAGETIEQILERKEQERLDNGGFFFWGIGNSVAPGLSALLERTSTPEVLFSPTKGKPRPVDRAPAALLAWRMGETLDGGAFELPPTARVTSGSAGRRSGRAHYALVCESPRPLTLSGEGQVDFLALRNLLSGSPLGASQVTAVVRRVGDQPPSDMRYPVALRARLAAPYFVRLTEAVEERERLAS